jgi:hypothetical protein
MNSAERATHLEMKGLYPSYPTLPANVLGASPIDNGKEDVPNELDYTKDGHSEVRLRGFYKRLGNWQTDHQPSLVGQD